jgi:hypothetical protein
MTPGGHLATTIAACGVAYAATGSLPLTAGVAAGGFGIDLDHVFDYVVFERQRDLHPDRFLRYCLEGKNRVMVLILHSYELIALLALMAWWTGWEWLIGYAIGAAMHLFLDITFNGELYLSSPWKFYSVFYRMRYRFSTARLGSLQPRPTAPERFWAAFFKGAAVSNPGNHQELDSRQPSDRRAGS